MHENHFNFLIKGHKHKSLHIYNFLLEIKFAILSKKLISLIQHTSLLTLVVANLYCQILLHYTYTLKVKKMKNFDVMCNFA